MIGDRQRGLDALQLWYKNSVVQISHSFDDVVAFYDDESPSFIEDFGGAVRQSDLPQDRLVDSFSKLNNPDGSKLPDKNSFFTALAGEDTTITWDDFKDIAAKTVSDVKQTAVIGAAAYGLWIVGGLIAVTILTSLREHSS